MKQWILAFSILAIQWSDVAAQGAKENPFQHLLGQLMTVPNAVDRNQDGWLSSEEVLAAPESLLTLDKNGDGSLNLDEMGAYRKDLPFVRSHLITNMIDADGDVRLSVQEIANAPSALKNLDRNGDWQISRVELSLGRAPNAPLFTPRNLSPTEWEKLQAYSVDNEGPLLPGSDSRAADGLMLVHNNGDYNQIQRTDNTTYLLDASGNKVHVWENAGYLPEATVAYLLPNGQLLRTLSNHHWTKDKYFPVGAHSSIQLVDWNSTVLWEFSMSVPGKYSFHHDVEYLPNGNILAIRYTGFTREEAMALGWNPALGQRAMKRLDSDGTGLVWLDSVLELKPDLSKGLSNGNTEIVWQWNSWDHLVQDTFPHKMNYGDVTNPAKINVNYLNLDADVPFNAGQFYHTNSVDYHPQLDMIMLSSPTFGEVWFIDHSTSVQEAATGQGGVHNSGGDLLYRWGNDEAFGKGKRDNSVLYWQHDAHWIEQGLPGAGNLLVYNNGSRRTLDGKYMTGPPKSILSEGYTNLLEVKLPMNSNGTFSANESAEIVWSWQSPNKSDYFSPFMSGLQRLPNGNTIFCRAYDKYVTEVTPSGKKVLDFRLAGWGRLHRIYKYPADYSGLGFGK